MEKDRSFVGWDFQGDQYFLGNNISKNGKSIKHELFIGQICYRKADANFWKYNVQCHWQGKYARMEKILYVWFWITYKNINSNNAFCVMKLNGLKEGTLI